VGNKLVIASLEEDFRRMGLVTESTQQTEGKCKEGEDKAPATDTPDEPDPAAADTEAPVDKKVAEACAKAAAKAKARKAKLNSEDDPEDDGCEGCEGGEDDEDKPVEEGVMFVRRKKGSEARQKKRENKIYYRTHKSAIKLSKRRNAVKATHKKAVREREKAVAAGKTGRPGMRMISSTRKQKQIKHARVNSGMDLGAALASLDEVRDCIEAMAGNPLREIRESYANLAIVADILDKRFSHMAVTEGNLDLLKTAEVAREIAQEAADIAEDDELFEDVNADDLTEDFKELFGIALDILEAYALKTEGAPTDAEDPEAADKGADAGASGADAANPQ
jgi:hypothetical protein